MFIITAHGFRGGRGWDVGRLVVKFNRGGAVSFAKEAVDFGWFYWLAGIGKRGRCNGAGGFWGWRSV